MADGAPPARRSLGQRAFYALAKAVTLLALLVFFRLRRRGRAHAPRTGALLIVANHQSYLDPPMIGVTLARQFHPLARAGLFESRWFGWLLRTVNSIPIRTEGNADTSAMRRALELLHAGAIVLIFPEGTRTQTGEVGAFERGAGVLIKRAQCPVAPAAVEGAFEAWPRSRKWPRLFSKVGVVIGEPIPHDELLREGVDAALDRLRNEVVRLKSELQAERAGKARRGGSG